MIAMKFGNVKEADQENFRSYDEIKLADKT